ncbi:ATP-binding protein [Mesorhizobium sp. L103C105A0]|uniref:ATP-dependent nuclease n=1 Tax=Mesorhizobium sp. L103C105A0 TaxID=1287074 RepID=UPI0003CFABE3|nr:ATP-binding protein [Mesorhizobium sp. L103C105A0]ESZ70059.1 chromosome segregation protein SMC [Mesorhizobium sp. L103C105A0]
MARIRLIEIVNFRGIKELTWAPSAGINCLIGPGDSCKSSILDAIDLCLGARRNLQITDADFFNLDVTQPISISCTIGALTDRLKNIEAYGLYVRNFIVETAQLEDEPEAAGETVLAVNLSVDSDLEPVWTLISKRAADAGLVRNLVWADRQAIAPTRIGAFADGNLAWRRGSVLNKLSEEKADISAELVKAAREARVGFGDRAGAQLGATLAVVKDTADELGIQVGDNVKAMLDAHSVSFSGGSISLHSDTGIPLRALGVGSTRLLTAGLQRKAAAEATMVLVDELEHGLEPHRIHRLLGSLGSKDTNLPLQVFATTHSPVALQELSGTQLMIVRRNGGQVSVQTVGAEDDVQSTIRRDPEAFLAPSVIICEGASEVGLLRGLDQFRVAQGEQSLTALGVALLDAGGVANIYKRANALLKLGYRCHVLRDDDVEPDAADEAAFLAGSGAVTKWPAKRKLEQELFLSLGENAAGNLVVYAVELHGEDLIDEHIKSKSGGLTTYNDVDTALLLGDFDQATRELLGVASSTRSNGWFKQVTLMENAARLIIAPGLEHADASFVAIIDALFAWMRNGR